MASSSTKKVKLLTKVSKGIAFGDVSNASVRNILTEISKKLYGPFTEDDMELTLNFFGWKCPYTEKDLKPLILGKKGGYATDHIYPQNKDFCGLNVLGNLVIVDSVANNAKGKTDAKSFLLNNTKFFGPLSMKTRLARWNKIEKFQKNFGYDYNKITSIVKPLMDKRYAEIRTEQEKWIEDSMVELKAQGIAPKVSITPAKTPKAAASGKARASRSPFELIFTPSDEEQFKKELLSKKKAHFVLTYDTGAAKIRPWDAKGFKASSNLKSNIQSQTFWRNGKTEGLLKVEVFID